MSITVQRMEVTHHFPIFPAGFSIVLESQITSFSIPEYKTEYNEERSICWALQKKLEYLEKIYIFESRKEVQEYLLNNEELIEILLDSFEHIKKIGGDYPLYLELHHDPEEEFDELFIVIKTNLSPEKALKLEEALFNEWFISIMDRVKNKLNFTEEPL